MSSKEEDLLKKLRAIFAVESQEHLQNMISALLELEKTPSTERQQQLIEVIFREAHSLKGASRVVNMPGIEALSQGLESVFSCLKRQTIKQSPEMFDTLHRVLDCIGQLATEITAEQAGPFTTAIRELISELAKFENAATVPTSPVVLETKINPMSLQQSTMPSSATSSVVASSSTTDTTAHFIDKSVLSKTQRIPTEKLDSLLLQGEEMLAVKLSLQQRSANLKEVQNTLGSWNKKWSEVDREVHSVRQSLESQERNHQQSGPASPWDSLLVFLDWNNTFIKGLEQKVIGLATAAELDRHHLSGMVDNLTENMKQLLMLSFSTLWEPLSKLVRDLSREQGKEIELTIKDGDVEIDKRILEEMKDVLIHIVRNCIDHGIEKPDERQQQGKSRSGMISGSISQIDSNMVEIIISDDGAGIDIDKLKAAALKLGVISEKNAQELNQQQLLALAFRSEVSTSPIITEISGRGLGLAIVQEKVEKLGGHLLVESAKGIGTTFRIFVPLTLATFRGILVQVSGQTFVIPTANVERMARIKPEEIKTVENRETIKFNQQTIALARLDSILEQRTTRITKEQEFTPVVIISMGKSRIAFAIDAVLNDQEVLAKTLEKPLSRVRNIAGATILGSGQVAIILNVADLMKSAVRTGAPTSRLPATEPLIETRRKSILVVEDSITSRMLLQNILESAGYQVATAVDGIDGLTRLKTENFDLVVSDIDMPRMSGLDLTAKIRSEKKLADIPVILVTALASREDRERGVDVGANAYIVKSTFDQSNLLDIIHKLI